MNFRTKKTPALAHSHVPEPTHTPLPPCAAAHHRHALLPDATASSGRSAPASTEPVMPTTSSPSLGLLRVHTTAARTRPRPPPPSTSSRCRRPRPAPPTPTILGRPAPAPFVAASALPSRPRKPSPLPSRPPTATLTRLDSASPGTCFMQPLFVI
jgi:hypothetical protein